MYNYILLKLSELSLKKRELLQSKYPNINLSLLEQCDPTPTAEYINWIIKLYLNKTIILPEDQSKIYSALKRYTLGKKENRFPQQYKDINAFKSYGELEQALVLYLGKDLEEIKVMDGYNNSRILYNQNGWEVIQVNDVDDLVNLSQGTKWCTRNGSHANDYIKKGSLYLINFKNQRYCLIHPATNQMKNVYDIEFERDDLDQIIYLLKDNNIIPVNDFVKILIQKEYLQEKEFEDYKNMAIEKGKKSPTIAYMIIEHHSITRNDPNYQELLNVVLENNKDRLKLIKEKIITKEDGNLFFDEINNIIKNNDDHEAYGLLTNEIITKKEHGSNLFYKLIEISVYHRRINIVLLLEDSIISENDSELANYEFINQLIYDARPILSLLNYKIITKERNKNLFYECFDNLIKMFINASYHAYAAEHNIKNYFYNILSKGIIKQDDDEEIYNNLIKITMNFDDKYINSSLIKEGIINRKNYQFFKNIILELITGPSEAYDLLKNKIITKKQDGQLFYTCVDSAIKDATIKYLLLHNKIITREEDGQLFINIIKSLNITYIDDLLEENIITQEDVQLAERDYMKILMDKIKEQNNMNQPTAKIINQLIKTL